MQNIIINILKYVAIAASIYLTFRLIPNHSMSSINILIITIIMLLIFIVFENIFNMTSGTCSGNINQLTTSETTQLCNSVCNKEGMENIINQKQNKIPETRGPDESKDSKVFAKIIEQETNFSKDNFEDKENPFVPSEFEYLVYDDSQISDFDESKTDDYSDEENIKNLNDDIRYNHIQNNTWNQNNKKPIRKIMDNQINKNNNQNTCPPCPACPSCPAYSHASSQYQEL